MTTSVSDYLRALSQKHHTGQATDETSYYPPLEHLLNEIGESLSPKVSVLMTIKNRGAGIPDGGLFSANQLVGRGAPEVGEGALPARGALEVKGLATDIEKIAESEQAKRYLARYGQVILTNYRDFLLLGRDSSGNRLLVDRFTIANSETEFWDLARTHEKSARQLGDGLTRFLQRAMVRPAPISSPEDLAWVLAAFAQEALRRVEHAPLDALDNFRLSLEEALLTRFDDKKGRHFFHSTLVQTLFYGIFSAWVIWCREDRKGERFNWRDAAWTLHLPAIKSLFSEVATPRRIQYLELAEVLDWTGDALSRVDRRVFFEKFEDRLAIQYFYEPFLENFDPDLRKELGVWYTPPEVVEYMVERIDKVLREELGIAQGFAGEDVYVLDPCAGTGSFLLEVLRRIAQTRRESGEEEFVGAEVKKAAMERIFGFEIIPAPFVVAHLQIGLFLSTLKAPLDPRRDERASVFLTNSLTGWEPPKGPQKKLTFIELQEEKDAADKVKRSTPILVVLGNPPYNAYAGTSPEEERGLVDVYKAGLRGTWNIKKFNLDEIYARFLRVAERQIAEHSKRGVVCYISSYSYLSDPSFVILRERFFSGFDKAWIDSLNGDSRETGKRTPAGLPDPSIFSTERNREGIRLGTCVGLFVSGSKRPVPKIWRYRDLWGSRKREELVSSLRSADFEGQYKLADPKRENQYNFRPVNVAPEYYSWAAVSEVCRAEGSNGLMEKRHSSLIGPDQEPLRRRMVAYFDRAISWDELQVVAPSGLTQNAAGFNAIKAREKAKTKGFDESHIVNYAVRPFDIQFAYYTAVPTIWNRARPWLWSQCKAGNQFLITRRHGSKFPEGSPFWWTGTLFDDSLLQLHATGFPVRVKDLHRRLSNLEDADASPPTSHNYSPDIVEYLKRIGVPETDTGYNELVWLHILAIGYSRKYLEENSDGIKQDWPRVPLPDSAQSLRTSARFGRRVADLLDLVGVPGVSQAPLRPEIQVIGKMATVSGKPLEAEESLRVTAGWGRIQQDGVFPGPGKLVTRPYTPAEIHAIEEGSRSLQLTREETLAILGESTCDVYLSDDAYWGTIPENVWTFHVGGQQVIKKWLSYRELAILGRPLAVSEAKHVREMARRIAALLLMQPSLDQNYLNAARSAYPWSPKSQTAAPGALNSGRGAPSAVPKRVGSTRSRTRRVARTKK